MWGVRLFKGCKIYRTCVVCSAQATDMHHIKTRKSGGSDDPWNLMPLCRMHHQETHRIGAASFALKHIQARNYLHGNGWQIVDEFGVKKLRRS